MHGYAQSGAIGSIPTDACQQKASYAGNNASQPAPNDPASLRGQFMALGQLCERLASQRNALRDIADTLLGPEPEDAASGLQAGRIQPVGGVTAEIVAMFESAATLLYQIDREISRLQRVSS